MILESLDEGEILLWKNCGHSEGKNRPVRHSVGRATLVDGS